MPARGTRAGRRRHALRPREHRGRVRGRRRARAPGPRRARSGSRRASSRARGVERVMRYAFELAEARRGVAHERDQVERLALRLRALGRGRRGGRRGASRASATSACSSTRSRPGWCATPDSLDVVVASNLFGGHPHRPRRGDPGRDGHGREREPRARHGRARALRARARLGAGHRRPGHRQPGGRDLERRRSCSSTSASGRPRPR